jgi:hypothetical protein
MNLSRLLVPFACALVVGGGCLGAIDVGGTGGAPDNTGPEGGSAGSNNNGGEGGEEGCFAPLDGFCDDKDDCACTACAPAAACQAGGCMANGFCDLLFEDSCVCSDCDWDSECLGPAGGGNCANDGACDTALEGCGCADCIDEPTCQDNHQLCAGGMPDGVCDPMLEGCSCNDCLGAMECYCKPDELCTFDEPCVCFDCWADSFCSDPKGCLDDGMCDFVLEGCQCQDCAFNPFCAGFPG